MTDKAALRRELKRRRAALPRREEKNAALLAALTALPELQQARALLCYVSVGEEPDTRSLLEVAWARGQEVYAPVCRPGGRLTFHRVAGWEDLAPAPFGLLEPDPLRCPAWTPGPGAVCVVPGLAFDETGHRLGYGKGYYDRFLAVFEGIAVGLCYGALLLPALPREAHDRPVQLLVTEDGPVRPARAREEGGPPHE